MRRSFEEHLMEIEQGGRHFSRLHRLDAPYNDADIEEEIRIWSNYEFCRKKIYEDPKNFDLAILTYMGKTNVNELVSDAMALGHSKAILRLVNDGYDLSRPQLESIVGLIDEKMAFNVTHGGISDKEYLEYLKKNAKAIEKVLKRIEKTQEKQTTQLGE